MSDEYPTYVKTLRIVGEVDVFSDEDTDRVLQRLQSTGVRIEDVDDLGATH